MPYQLSEMLGGGQNCMMMYTCIYTTDLCPSGDRIDDHPSSICMYQLAELIESISSEQIWEHIFQKSNLLVEQRIPWLVVVSHTVADPTHRKSSQREKNTNTNKTHWNHTGSVQYEQYMNKGFCHCTSPHHHHHHHQGFFFPLIL
jgi:hypothetical protein